MGPLSIAREDSTGHHLSAYSRDVDTNVRRGLGLLAVAGIAWLIGMAALQADSWPLAVLVAAAALVAVCSLLGGLGLLAYGLLRRPAQKVE